jgi:hypothetical protein
MNDSDDETPFRLVPKQVSANQEGVYALILTERPDIARIMACIAEDFAASTESAGDRAWIRSLRFEVFRVSDLPTMLNIEIVTAAGERFGFGVPTGGGVGATVVEAADGFQDVVADNLRKGLPMIPGSRTPASARLVDGVPCWVDPTSHWKRPIAVPPADRGSQ